MPKVTIKIETDYGSVERTFEHKTKIIPFPSLEDDYHKMLFELDNMKSIVDEFNDLLED